MRIKTLFLAALAVMTFASCSKDEGNNNPEGKTQTIVVKLPDNVAGAETRALDDPATTGTKTVLTDVEVFLLTGNAVNSRHSFTGADFAGGKVQYIEQVAAGVNGVLVVANIPTADQAVVKAYKNVSDIENHAYTIADQSTTGLNKKLHMGKTTTLTVITPNPSDLPGDHSDHMYKEAKMTLDAITARFEIGHVIAGEGVESVELLGVWMNNYMPAWANTTLKLHAWNDTVWNTTPEASTSPSDTPFGTVTIPAYTVPSYYTAGSTSVHGNAGSKVYAYQLFAGAYVPHLILLVKGEYKDGYYDEDTDEKYFLMWLTYDKFIDGSAITAVAANTIYKVGLGGIEVNAKELTPKPELGKFDMGIKIDVTPWTEKNVTPGIQ